MMLEKGAHSNWAKNVTLEDACLGMHICPTTMPTCASHASEARFTLRSWDPVKSLVWDAVLAEKKAQLGRMFLNVTQGIQQEFKIACRLSSGPGVINLLMRFLV